MKNYVMVWFVLFHIVFTLAAEARRVAQEREEEARRQPAPGREYGRATDAIPCWSFDGDGNLRPSSPKKGRRYPRCHYYMDENVLKKCRLKPRKVFVTIEDCNGDSLLQQGAFVKGKSVAYNFERQTGFKIPQLENTNHKFYYGKELGSGSFGNVYEACSCTKDSVT